MIFLSIKLMRGIKIVLLNLIFLRIFMKRKFFVNVKIKVIDIFISGFVDVKSINEIKILSFV